MEAKERLSDMRVRALVQLPVVLVAILTAAPACAQLYKWVDERGVTNYSNMPPADPQAAKKLQPVENRVSVYTPDRALMQAVEAFHQRRSQASAERIARLEGELDAERRARQYAATAGAEARYDPCFSNPLSCNGMYNGYYPYGPSYVFLPVRHRPRPLVTPQLIPGTIAGNVLGMNGFIPGNSAGARPRAVRPARSIQEAPMSRGLTTR